MKKQNELNKLLIVKLYKTMNWKFCEKFLMKLNSKKLIYEFYKWKKYVKINGVLILIFSCDNKSLTISILNLSTAKKSGVLLIYLNKHH